MAKRKTKSKEDEIVSHISKQLNSKPAQRELKKLGPREIDWSDSTKYSTDVFVPSLIAVAPILKSHLNALFRGPLELETLLAKTLKEISDRGDKSSEKIIRKFAKKAGGLIGVSKELVSRFLVAQTITKVIEDFIPNSDVFKGQVVVNGSSLYPDIYLNDSSDLYSKLPVQKRGGRAIDGPCRNGKGQPSKAPNGLEIKTKRGTSIRVDCHAPNPGLHLVINWDTDDDGFIEIEDISLAYIRLSDYTECARNAKATTVKYSFNADPFISLLDGKKK